MAVAIVDLLELVEIDQHQAQRNLFSLRHRPGDVQPVAKLATVEGSGQRVLHRAQPQFALQQEGLPRIVLQDVIADHSDNVCDDQVDVQHHQQQDFVGEQGPGGTAQLNHHHDADTQHEAAIEGVALDGFARPVQPGCSHRGGQRRNGDRQQHDVAEARQHLECRQVEEHERQGCGDADGMREPQPIGVERDVGVSVLRFQIRLEFQHSESLLPLLGISLISETRYVSPHGRIGFCCPLSKF